MNEFEIIAEIFAPLASAPGAFGLKDDAAAIPARPGFDLIVTTDQIAEGTDFFAFDTPSGIARKALRVNLSDLAAKGAAPAYYLLNLALPATVTADWLKSFAIGLRDDQEQFAIALLGGDIGSTEGPLAIGVTAFGFVPEGKMVRRNGAKQGDIVYVTGTIGDSGGGLQIRKEKPADISARDRNFLLDAYHLPKPPVAFAQAVRTLASSSVDISDGLIADLGHLAASSGVKIELDAEAIPFSEALLAFRGNGADAIILAVTAGDDYQIAFTANPATDAQIQFEASIAGITVTRIGAVTAGQGVELRHRGQIVSVPRRGYRHF
jgi:thiamine-monophosphate kinase